MGTDIHWFLERRDTYGAWHCTLSKGFVFRFGELAYPSIMGFFRSEPCNPVDVGLDPAVADCAGVLLTLTGRHYPMFAVLSNLRHASYLDACIARPGLPEDACAITSHEIDTDSDLHSVGWVSFADFPFARPSCDHDDPRTQDMVDEGMEAVTRFRDGLLSAAGVPSLADAPLFAPVDTIRKSLAENAAEFGWACSAHARRRMARVSETLSPPSPETVRVIIAYDS